ncbi:MAG: hypothetical protein AVDCRST_MAG88-834, partial [uncultured Thermomicrobiales bacterium]
VYRRSWLDIRCPVCRQPPLRHIDLLPQLYWRVWRRRLAV